MTIARQIFMWIKQIEGSNISLYDVKLSEKTFLCTSIRIYSLLHSHATLSATHHHWKNTEDMTTLSTADITAGSQVLYNSVEVFLIDGLHCLETVWQVHERDVWERLSNTS